MIYSIEMDLSGGIASVESEGVLRMRNGTARTSHRGLVHSSKSHATRSTAHQSPSCCELHKLL